MSILVIPFLRIGHFFVFVPSKFPTVTSRLESKTAILSLEMKSEAIAASPFFSRVSLAFPFLMSLSHSSSSQEPPSISK